MTWDELRTTLFPFLPATSKGFRRHENGGGWVRCTAVVERSAYVGPRALMRGGAMRGGRMFGGAMHGGAMYGGATLCDGMVIREPRDMLVIGPIGTRNAYLTMTRTHAATGCFGGTWDELRSRLTDENRADYERVLRFAAEHFEKEATR